MSKGLFDLTGKVALVTGASRGIGKEIAKIIAEYGAHVIVSSRKIEDCRTVSEEILSAGGSSEAISLNIGNMDDISSAFTHICKEHGKLDILVNNAATNSYFGNILETDPVAFDKSLQVNIRGSFYMAVEAGKLMREHGGGVILNTASIAGITPGVGQGVYSIVKAAVINMTKAFAKECARDNIRCNALLPGLIKTHFSAALFTDDEIYSKVIERTPMQRHATPEEMAGSALYLVSQASSFTTGQCIVADGGLTV